MKNRRVRQELIAQGLRIGDLAKMLGCTIQHASNFLTGRVQSKFYKEKISILLGKPVEELWPEDRET